MKTLYASLLAMAASGATPLLAEPAELVRDGCPLTGARSEVSADCAALQADYAERLGDCLALRRDAAEQRTGRTDAGNAHASRANHLACDSEVRLSLGIAAE